MNYDVDYSTCLAKFWGSSDLAIMLPDFRQNLELRIIYAFIHCDILMCLVR